MTTTDRVLIWLAVTQSGKLFRAAIALCARYAIGRYYPSRFFRWMTRSPIICASRLWLRTVRIIELSYEYI
ncbi:MAG: hypothetical protein GDA43_03845 [Hormoscilla sp. SP5CHS1]|nr:hypothetical protein [Hormoscilla sp. SP12CHS1]MBC6452428.1 hypothetical protein [Hormoscilla sp. SP5CHS1]